MSWIRMVVCLASTIRRLPFGSLQCFSARVDLVCLMPWRGRLQPKKWPGGWTYNAFSGKVQFTMRGLDHSQKSVLSIYDINGTPVKSMEVASGDYTWDMTDRHGQVLPQGVYLSVLKTENRTITKLMYLTQASH